MNRITNEQREAIVRKAVAERDELLARQRDDEAAPDDEAKCPACDGDGGDKWNDYALPCSVCGGDGRLW